MKTNSFRRMVFAFVLLTTLVFFGSAKEKDAKFDYYYSNLGANELAEYQIVCVYDENGKHLKPKLKYLFTYDENNRVVKKEGLRWSNVENDWVHSFCLTFVYDDDSMVTEYAKWNKREKNYDECTEKAVYKINANMFASYSSYTRGFEGEWKLENNCLINIPVETLWNGHGLFIAEANR